MALLNYSASLAWCGVRCDASSKSTRFCSFAWAIVPVRSACTGASGEHCAHRRFVVLHKRARIHPCGERLHLVVSRRCSNVCAANKSIRVVARIPTKVGRSNLHDVVHGLLGGDVNARDVASNAIATGDLESKNRLGRTRATHNTPLPL